jgi:hypothetical protein
MKKLLVLVASAALVLVYSCNSDISTAQLTYLKATAIYGDLDVLRDINLNEEVRSINDPGKVYVSDNLLLIGEEGEGIHVYDNTNPENPSPLSFINIPSNKEFFVKDNFIYAESLYDMLKIDISDKTNPILRSRVENAFVQDFTNDKGEVLIDFEFEVVTEEIEEGTDMWNQINNEGQAYFDFQRRLIPSSAVPTSFAGSSNSSTGTVNRIAHADNHVYVISNSYLTVFSDNQNLEFIQTEWAGVAMETIYPQDKLLFIGTRNSVEIFDIEIPSTPVRKASFDHVDSCDPVLPDGDIAYVTLRTNDTGCPGDINALLVLDISPEFNITQLQEIPMASPFGMTKIGDLLYVGEGENGLKIFDASNRSRLSILSSDRDVQAYDVIAHPTRSDVILIAGPNGFAQYSVNETNQDLSLLSIIQI